MAGTVTDAAERLDLALRATLSGFVGAAISILINYEHGAPTWPVPGESFWEWPLQYSFLAPLFGVMVIGKQPSPTIGGAVLFVCAVMQTAVLACGVSSAMYAWLVHISLGSWKIVAPFLFFALGFVQMACTWLPAKPIAQLFVVLVIGNPIRASVFRGTTYLNALGVVVVIQIAIGCLSAICSMLLPLPRLQTLTPLPPSAALRSYEKLRRARLLVASILLEFFMSNPHSPSTEPDKLAATRARLARMQRIQHELETVLSAMAAMVPFAKVELLLVGRRTDFARLDAARKLLSTQSILLAAMVRQSTNNLDEVSVGHVDDADDLALDALYYDEVAPSLRALAAELAQRWGCRRAPPPLRVCGSRPPPPSALMSGSQTASPRTAARAPSSSWRLGEAA